MHDLPKLIICGTIISLLQNVLTSPTIQINDGQIVGQKTSLSGHKVNQYLGIPYAQPPIGPLRFKKPLPFQNYTPIFHANINPPACSQYATLPSFPWYIRSSNKSEDCLYLNIWTPGDAGPTNKKSVLFWIHGGGFKQGSIRAKPYSGIPLSALGDIIVVTVNYRLGPFGFLTSSTEDAPPNVGLWDILEGLKWVNQNIESFGGDVSKITISGQSAGGNAVGFLSVSPKAQGLYTRLIMQSGTPNTRELEDNTMNLALTQRLAKKVGCANDTYSIASHPNEVVQCMRDVDADTLSRDEFELHTTAVQLETFAPQWGDDLLPVNPRIAVNEGNFGCKDLLIGNTRDEGSLFITSANPHVYGFFGQKNPRVNKTLGQETIQNAAKPFPDSQSILQYYLPANTSDHQKIRHQAYTVIGDTIFVCANVYYAEKCAEQGKNVYYYYFTHRPSVTPWATWMGVAHYEEVQFVFGQPILDPQKYQPDEVALSQQMIDIWSHFVKEGRPNIPWPLYSREKPLFKYLGPNNITGKNGFGPHEQNCNFMRPYF